MPIPSRISRLPQKYLSSGSVAKAAPLNGFTQGTRYTSSKDMQELLAVRPSTVIIGLCLVIDTVTRLEEVCVEAVKPRHRKLSGREQPGSLGSPSPPGKGALQRGRAALSAQSRPRSPPSGPPRAPEGTEAVPGVPLPAAPAQADLSRALRRPDPRDPHPPFSPQAPGRRRTARTHLSPSGPGPTPAAAAPATCHTAARALPGAAGPRLRTARSAQRLH